MNKLLIIIGLVTIALVSFIASENLQELKLLQIDFEAQIATINLEIKSLEIDKSDLNKTIKEGNKTKDNISSQIKKLDNLNQEITFKKINLNSFDKKLIFIKARTKSYTQGGILLLLISIFLITFALIKEYRRVK
ncbi:hypothetical protein K8R32_02720 [bacterium]|nr:hypothetical protein [bacterium]